MKIKYLFTVLIFFSTVFVIYLTKRSKARTEYVLVERSGSITNSSEWINTKAAIEKLLGDLRKNPENSKLQLQLAMAYIQESRVTGNHSYYDGAALELIDKVLEEKPDDYEALCAKATILLSQHHFEDALKIGKKVIRINNYSAYGYGILTDANVELGKYDQAILFADKMVSIRPDIRSYSRVSYLREIFGDTEGAISAMKMAVDAGIPGTEQTEWARVYLGHLHEMTGDIDKAFLLYQQSLLHRPNYAYAEAGMGRIAKYRGNYKEAIKHLTNAKYNLIDYAFSETLADVYQAMLDKKGETAELNEAIKMLSYSNNDESDLNHGHYSDKELALLYLKIYKYDKALIHAQTEYNRRPDNIDINQTLAWVRYRRGEYAEAEKKIEVALRTNSKNPVLLFQAGLIKAKAGKITAGKKLMQESLAINPFITQDLRWEAKPYLNQGLRMANN